MNFRLIMSFERQVGDDTENSKCGDKQAVIGIRNMGKPQLAEENRTTGIKVANMANSVKHVAFRGRNAASLHMSSSQKHMCPVPELSIMHTWSTINKFICNCDVHVRRTTSYAGNNNTHIRSFYIYLQLTEHIKRKLIRLY